MQIIGTQRRSIFHAVKYSQIPYTAIIKKINNFTSNKIKNPLELRLNVYLYLGDHSPATSQLQVSDMEPGSRSLHSHIQTVLEASFTNTEYYIQLWQFVAPY